MPRWHNLLTAIALTLPSVAHADDNWQGIATGISTEPTIIAGGKACVGTTVDAASQGARILGWTPITGSDRQKLHTDGDVVTRDNAMLIYKNGIEGGCVVVANAAAPFDTPKFYADLGTAIGVRIPIGDGKQPPQVDLPNGEMMIIVVAPKDKQFTVVLVLANQVKKDAKKGS